MRAATYGYDANDNLLSETLTPTGLSGSGNQSYGYDRADRLTSWTKQNGSTTTYGWDAAGNRTSAGGTASTFDERNRQLSDGSGTYTYSSGNRVTRTQGSTTANTGWDAFDRLVSDTTSGTVSYGYDGLDWLAVRGSSTFIFSLVISILVML